MRRFFKNNPYIEVRRSRIHGTGVFARQDIPKDTHVIEYVGRKMTKAQSEKYAQVLFDKAVKDPSKGAVYIFELNKRMDVDGSVWYNTAKYINHSCDPNCETDIIRGRIWIIALRDLKKGEEFTYNYGYSMDEWEEHPCRCGSKNCVGYILAEENWKKLKKIQERRAHP